MAVQETRKKEGWWIWARRANNIVKAKMSKLQHVMIVERALRQHFRWMGHVARMNQESATKWSLDWRGAEW